METSTIRSLATPGKALLFLLICILAAFFPVLLGKFYVIGDTRDVYIPLEIFFKAQQLEWQLPQWNPNIAWGYPTIASAQIGFFYPPLLLLRFLPLALYLPVLLLAHFTFLATGTYIFFRSLLLSKHGSILGSLAFTLGGFTILHLTHLNIIFALAWLPWQLILAQQIAVKTKPKISSHLLLIALIAAPFLAGQIQIPLLIAAVSSIYLLSLTTKKATTFSNSLKSLLVIAAISFLLSGAQLLPTLELAQYSSRNDSEGFSLQRANRYSYPLYHLPTFIFPRFYGNDDTYWGKSLQIEYGFYLGTIPTALLGIGLIESIRRKQNKFWLWLALVASLLALGSWSPFRLLKIEPSLWFFSAPSRWLLFTSLSFSYLAGYGLDIFLQQKNVYKKYLKFLLILLTAIVIATNLSLFVINHDSLLSWAGNQLGEIAQIKLTSMLSSARHTSLSALSPYTYLPLIALFIALISISKKKTSKLLIYVSAIELIILALTTTPTLSWRNALATPESVNQLPQEIIDKEARFYSLRDGGDTGAYFTNPETRANQEIREQQRQLLVPLSHTQHDLASIEWPASLTLSNQVATLESLKDKNNELKTQRLAETNVGAVISLEDNQLQIQTIASKPRIEIISDDPNSTIEHQEISPTLITIQSSSHSPAKIIMRDTWYPAWQARVNNQATPIDQTSDNFRSINIPAGENTIIMKYHSRAQNIGILLSLGTLFVIILIYCVSRYKSQTIN